MHNGELFAFEELDIIAKSGDWSTTKIMQEHKEIGD
jgi:hypothetical protein